MGGGIRYWISESEAEGACTALIEILKNESQKEYVSPNEIARYYGLMGDRDHTFEWLEKGYAERSGAWNT